MSNAKSYTNIWTVVKGVRAFSFNVGYYLLSAAIAKATSSSIHANKTYSRAGMFHIISSNCLPINSIGSLCEWSFQFYVPMAYTIYITLFIVLLGLFTNANSTMCLKGCCFERCAPFYWLGQSFIARHSYFFR